MCLCRLQALHAEAERMRSEISKRQRAAQALDAQLAERHEEARSVQREVDEGRAQVQAGREALRVVEAQLAAARQADIQLRAEHEEVQQACAAATHRLAVLGPEVEEAARRIREVSRGVSCQRGSG